MKSIQNALGIAALSGILIGCSGPAADTAPSASVHAVQTELAATEITWEDLMPAGEDEILETLYVEFYEEFERNMFQNSTSLAAAAKQDVDVSSAIIEGSAADTMEQIGTFNVVKDLDGKRIRVPGYIVPFDFNANAEYREFLLVPYFGACLHTPPPPPNQIILVKAEVAAKVEDIYSPFWLEGTLKTGEFRNDLGNSAYELNLTKIEPYEY